MRFSHFASKTHTLGKALFYQLPFLTSMMSRMALMRPKTRSSCSWSLTSIVMVKRAVMSFIADMDADVIGMRSSAIALLMSASR